MQEGRDGTLKGLSGVIRQLGEEFHLEEKKEFFEALKDWESLVGPRAAAHTKPLYIENRTLYVAAEGSAWAQEISFMRNKIMRGINNRLGRPHVNEVKCKIEEKKKK